MEKSSPPNGRACLSRASHQRCGPAASRDSPAAMRRGLRGVSPQDDIPKSSRAWGCPPRPPGGGGHAHPCTPQFVPSRIGHAPSAELRSAAILDRELDTRPRVRSVSDFRTSCRRGPSPMDVSSIATAYTAFSEVLRIRVGHGEPFRQRNTSALVAPGLSESGRRALPPTLPGDLVASVPRRPAIRHYRPAGRAGMATARRSPASHALHCLRLPGRRNIRLIADSM